MKAVPLLLGLLFLPCRTAQAADSGEEFTRNLVAREVTENPDLHSQQPRENPGPVLHTKDFGLSPQASPLQNSKALEEISKALREKKASALAFEPGDYQVQLQSKKPGFLLESLQDFTLKGNGARLVFLDALATSPISNGLLMLRDCNRVLVEKLSLVWNWEAKPLAVIGRITEVTKNRVEYEILSGGSLRADLEITGGREWDPIIENRSPRGYPPGFNQAARIVDERHLVFDGAHFGTPLVGQHSMLKIHAKADVWGVSLDGANDHLTFDELQIRGAPNTAMCGTSKHLWIKNSLVAPPAPGLFKACEDGFLVDADYYVLEGTEVQYALDDVSNFTAGRTGFFLGGGVLPDGPRSLIADHLQMYSAKPHVYVGGEFFLADGNFKPLEWHSKVTAFEWQANYHPATEKVRHRCKITFEDPVPTISASQSKEFILMHDSHNSGAYLIRNNKFSNTFCHGVWAGNGPGLIEHNTFYQTGYPAIGVMMLRRSGRWFKGFYPEGVVIRNNTLEHCNTALRRPGDIYAATGWDEKEFGASSYPAVRHLLIENNTINRSANSAIAILAAQDVTIIGNHITDPGQDALPGAAPSDAALYVIRSRDGRIEGNVLKEIPGASVKGMKVRDSSNFEVRP